MGYLIKNFFYFLRVRMERVRMGISDRKIFFKRFSKSSYGKGLLDIFDRKFFLRDSLRVRMGRVCMGYLIENFFAKFSEFVWEGFV